MILSQKRLNSDATTIKIDDVFENTVYSLSLSNAKIFDAVKTIEPHSNKMIATFNNLILKVNANGCQNYDIVLQDLDTNNVRGVVAFKNGIVMDIYSNMSKLNYMVASTATASYDACKRETVKLFDLLGEKSNEDEHTSTPCLLGKYQSFKENKALYSQLQSNMPANVSFATTQVCMMTGLLTAVGLNSSQCDDSLVIVNNSQVVKLSKDFWNAFYSFEPSKRRASVVVKEDNNTCKRINLAVRWCPHKNLPLELQSIMEVPDINRNWCFLSGVRNHTAVAIAPSLTYNVSKSQLTKYFVDTQ